jgi:hypothetical protein
MAKELALEEKVANRGSMQNKKIRKKRRRNS